MLFERFAIINGIDLVLIPLLWQLEVLGNVNKSGIFTKKSTMS
jgi:hypothetical protein